MMTDPIADMLTRLRNGNLVEKPYVDLPASNLKRSIARVLKDEGFINGYEESGEGPHKLLRVRLKYGPLGERVLHELWRVSSPGRRIYRSVRDLTPIRYGLGISILSTSKGVLSDRECRVQKVGGEVLCELY